MAEDRFDILSKKKVTPTLHALPEDHFDRVADEQRYTGERGIVGSFKRGAKSGVSGLLLGERAEAPPEDEGWAEYLSSLAGGLVSDAPAFWAGGEAGALAGAAAGSIVPGIGTGIGALAGGGAGAMALPTLIKSSFGEYRDFVDSGGDLTFGEFLERAGRIGKETSKAGAIGVATAGASRLLPALRRIPKLNKLLNTKPGRIAGEAALEVGGLTGSKAAIEGKLPTAKEFVGDVATVAGMKAARGTGEAAKKAYKRYSRRPVVEVGPKTESKYIKAVRELLPEEISKRLSPESRTKAAKWHELLKEYSGSKNAETVKSAFEWQEKQAKYEKAGGEFTPKQLEEMMYYAQKTGNPNKGFEDSYTDVKGRLPKHAQKFVDEVVRPHLKESLKAWNDHPATKDITPRDGLEEYYLPGVYEKASKAKLRSVEQKIRTKFKIKNPFSNPKTFMTYNEAAIEAGLKPRYKNVVDLMRHFDKVNIKTMHNAELLNMVQKFQQQTGEQVIVTENNPREYAKAQEKGYVEFEDPMLRSYRNKEGKFERTELPALVEPEFASAFRGVFTKEAFRPDGKYLKGLDAAKRQVNAMRVMASPFHYIAIMESILGARGLKGFRLMNMASEGRRLRQSKEFMVDAARHGLVVKKRLGIPELKKGNMLLERGLDLIIDSNSPAIIKKGVAKLKRGMTYMFDQFIPNAKAVIYEEMSTRELSKFKKEYKRAPTDKETKAIKRTVADVVNNLLGGQNWETSKWLNDPITRKKVSRIIAYPDWTISALKQAASATKPGLEGRLGRRYTLKYALYGSAVGAFLRAVLGGLEQTDEKNKSVGGIKFNPEKSIAALKDVKSYKDLLSFGLPDIPVRYGPGEKQVFNPGRDENGVKRKAHFGKQQFEVIEGWLQHPLATLYSKANPLLTTAYEQAMGQRPTRGGTWKIDKAYFRGREVPWGGKRGLWAQKWSRAAHLLQQITPFALRDGAEKWISSAFGSVPVAKQYTPYKAEDDIEKALLTKDTKKRDEQLEGIRVALRANNYKESDIKKRVTSVRNQLIKDGELPEALTLKRAEPRIREYLLSKDTKKLNALKKELIKEGNYTSKGVTSRISRIRNQLKRAKKL
jgi:hypothetical protein